MNDLSVKKTLSFLEELGNFNIFVWYAVPTFPMLSPKPLKQHLTLFEYKFCLM